MHTLKTGVISVALSFEKADFKVKAIASWGRRQCSALHQHHSGGVPSSFTLVLCPAFRDALNLSKDVVNFLPGWTELYVWAMFYSLNSLNPAQRSVLRAWAVRSSFIVLQDTPRFGDIHVIVPQPLYVLNWMDFQQVFSNIPDNPTDKAGLWSINLKSSIVTNSCSLWPVTTVNSVMRAPQTADIAFELIITISWSSSEFHII